MQNQSENLIWAELRNELAPKIAEARKILSDVEDAKTISQVQGFSREHRNKLLAQIVETTPSTATEFLEQVRKLQAVAAVPVEAFELHGRFLVSFLAKFLPAYVAVLDGALAALESRVGDPAVASIATRLRASRGVASQAIFESRYSAGLRWHCLAELFNENAAPLEKLWNELNTLSSVQ